MGLYDIVVDLVGTLPTEFQFIYTILTLTLGFLVLSVIFSLFYFPLKIMKGD